MKTIDGVEVHRGDTVYIIREGYDYGPRKNIRDEKVFGEDGIREWYSGMRREDLFYATVENALKARREQLRNWKVKVDKEIREIEKELGYDQ